MSEDEVTFIKFKDAIINRKNILRVEIENLPYDSFRTENIGKIFEIHLRVEDGEYAKGYFGYILKENWSKFCSQFKDSGRKNITIDLCKENGEKNDN